MLNKRSAWESIDSLKNHIKTKNVYCCIDNNYIYFKNVSIYLLHLFILIIIKLFKNYKNSFKYVRLNHTIH